MAQKKGVAPRHNLKPEVAKKLRRMLLSGKFKKTRNELRSGTSCRMCVEGVICELFRLETGRGEWSANGSFAVDGYERGGGVPPPVLKWADGEHDRLTIEDRPLTELNDGEDCAGNTFRPWSFAKFADALKPQPKRQPRGRK